VSAGLDAVYGRSDVVPYRSIEPARRCRRVLLASLAKIAPMPTTRPRREPTLGKLRPPRLGRAFSREGLFAQLDARATAPGVWIAGPLGMGKTTLVATYLEARGVPCVWLQLDSGDADPATFAHFLSAAAALIAPRRAAHCACRCRVPTTCAMCPASSDGSCAASRSRSTRRGRWPGWKMPPLPRRWRASLPS